MRVSPDGQAAEHEGAVRDRLVAGNARRSLQVFRAAGDGRTRFCGMCHRSVPWAGARAFRGPAFGGSPIMAPRQGHPLARPSLAAFAALAEDAQPFGFDRATNCGYGDRTSSTRTGSGEIRTWHKTHRPGDGSEILRSQQGSDRLALHGQDLSALGYSRRATRRPSRKRTRSRRRKSTPRTRLPRWFRSKRPTTKPRATTTPRNRGRGGCRSRR